MEEKTINDDLRIDKDSLDEEWLMQSILNHKYGLFLAEAKQKWNRAKEKTKTIKSELILEANKGGKDLIGTSATVASVDAWVRTQPEYKDAKEDEIECEFKVNILESAVFSFQQRKAALENEVQLWRGSYYGEPKDKTMDDEIDNNKRSRQRKNLNRGKHE